MGFVNNVQNARIESILKLRQRESKLLLFPTCQHALKSSSYLRLDGLLNRADLCAIHESSEKYGWGKVLWSWGVLALKKTTGVSRQAIEISKHERLRSFRICQQWRLDDWKYQSRIRFCKRERVPSDCGNCTVSAGWEIAEPWNFLKWRIQKGLKRPTCRLIGSQLTFSFVLPKNGCTSSSSPSRWP